MYIFVFIYIHVYMYMGLPWWLSGKEPACQCRMYGLIPGQEDLLEEEMATHSSILAWKIPWTEVPGKLYLFEGNPVREDTKRRVTDIPVHPVFLPRESCGQRSLMGCRLWGHTE